MENYEYISSRLQCTDEEKANALALAQRICGYADTARLNGPLALENVLEQEQEPFLQASLRRVVDAESADNLREALQIHILAANASGARFLEMMVIADGVCQLQKGMHPHALLSRLGEWFGTSYQEQVRQALTALDAEEQQRAQQARTQWEAQEAAQADVVAANRQAANLSRTPEVPEAVPPATLPSAAESPAKTTLTAAAETVQTPQLKATGTPPSAQVNNNLTFHQLGSCHIAAVERLLKDVDDHTVATALKGTDKALFSFFWSAMPRERCEKLLLDMSAMFGVTAQDVEQAQHSVLQTAKELEAKGELTLDFPDGELLAPHWEVIL